MYYVAFCNGGYSVINAINNQVESTWIEEQDAELDAQVMNEITTV